MEVREFLDVSILVWGAAILVDTVGSAYFAYVKLEKLASYFPNCEAVQSHRFLEGAGFWGRIICFGAICSVMSFPQRHVRYGTADQRDIDAIPGYVRLGLAIKTRISCFLLVCMIVLVAAHKYVERDSAQEFDCWGVVYVYAWILIAVMYWAYLAYFKRDEITGHLPNCEAVQTRVVFFNDSFFDRMLIVFCIALLLVHPKSCVQRGGADQRDIDAFPRGLRNYLLVGYALSMIMLINIVVGLFVMKN